MDSFNVPKKVNRHVLKALNILSGGNFKEGITTARICHQVKYQMRNLVPVPDIDHAIQKSLKNMSEIGLIERQGHSRFCMGRNYAPTPATNPNHNPPDRRIFRINENKQKSRSILDPNLKRNCHSDDSLSGDDFDKTRKRMRSNNKQLRHTGRTTILPRARQHKYPMTSFPNFLTAANNSSANIGTVVGNAKSSALEFMMASVTPVPSLEITEITEVKRSKSNRNIFIEKPIEVKEDTQDTKLEVEQNIVVQPSSRKSLVPTHSENATSQKVEKDPVPSSSSQTSSAPQKAKEAERLDVTLSYIN